MGSIKIYSWNLCFGCMYSNDESSKDETAQNLAMYCKEKKEATGNNVCLNNVIEKMSQVKFDFIGLQEATNYEEIYKRLITTHDSYRYTHSKARDEDMITIYDSDRFELDYVTVGDLQNGRPYQILFLTEKKNQKKFIVINLHAPHHFSSNDKDDIKKYFSKMLSIKFQKSFFNNKSKNNINYKDYNEDGDITGYIHQFASNFNTIVMGDFNDNGKHNIWKIFKPFEFVDVLRDITVTSNDQPPNTCCSGHILRKTIGDEKKYGDYILIDTTKMKYIINNVIPGGVSRLYNAKKFPTSDHLPVYSEIKEEVFILKPDEGNKTLRLQANGLDPNGKDNIKINNHFFKGSNIKRKDELKFPNGEIVKEFVLVVDMHDPNIIGYIRKKNLIPVNNYFIIKPVKLTLRLQPIDEDPVTNEYFNNMPFKGHEVNRSNIFVYPNGREVNVIFGPKNIVYVLVQKKDDPSVFGYVNKSYLIEIQSGGYYEKYLKYKSKYLELKNTI